MLPPRMAPGVTEKLGVYVYALIDPRDRSIFYVGKGVGDRVYSHVWSAMGAADLVEDGIEREARAVKSAKNQRIRDIYQSGKTVEHIILRHRIEPDATADKSAYAIEQTLIDALRLIEAPTGTAVLANIAGGHTTTEWGVIPLPELIRRYAAAAAPEIERPFVVLIVNAALNPDNSKEQIYEEGRGWWHAGPVIRNTANVSDFLRCRRHRPSGVSGFELGTERTRRGLEVLRPGGSGTGNPLRRNQRGGAEEGSADEAMASTWLASLPSGVKTLPAHSSSSACGTEVLSDRR